MQDFLSPQTGQQRVMGLGDTSLHVDPLSNSSEILFEISLKVTLWPSFIDLGSKIWPLEC